MTATDLTLQVLRQIRDEIAESNRRLGHLEVKVGAVVTRLGAVEKAIHMEGKWRERADSHEARIRVLEHTVLRGRRG